jgi:signal transduction histidine kinase
MQFFLSLCKVCIMDTPSFFVRIRRTLIQPKSPVEDEARREYILNVLILSTAVLLGALALLVITEKLFGGGADSENPLVMLGVTGVAFGLLAISRLWSYRLAGALFILLLWIALVYVNASRGVDLPMTWMYYALLVFISGIVISVRFAFAFTILVLVVLNVLTAWQVAGTDPFFIRSWREDGFYVVPDGLGFAFSLLVIYVVSWLFNREIDRSLARARASESALKQERDSLEIKVQERTRELKEEQRERFERVALFADFGKRASGVLHDLANPLTSMSLSLQQAREADPDTQGRLLERVIKGTERMEALLRTARSQFSPTAEVSIIDVAEEAEQAAEILSHVARKKDVRLDLSKVEPLELQGSPYAFNRVLLNLMSNAIEAYDGLDRSEAVVRLRSGRDGAEGFVMVEDEATGIAPEVMAKLFEPFASSKIGKGGTGMGLATAKSLAERDFHGSLSVESAPGKGSRFTFRFPLRTDGGV